MLASQTTARRARQLAAMPPLGAVPVATHRAANRAHNRLHARATTPAPVCHPAMPAGWWVAQPLVAGWRGAPVALGTAGGLAFAATVATVACNAARRA